MTRSISIAVAVAIAVSPHRATAYEPATTHAGMTARAALRSKLHHALRAAGVPLGLYARLIVDRAQMDVRKHRLLRLRLRRLDPAGFYRPDKKNGQRAIGWLLAGSVMAGMPASMERHHFHDPVRKAGLDNRASLLGPLLSFFAAIEGIDTVREFMTGTGFSLRGPSAVSWILDDGNPNGVRTFARELAAAVAAPTKIERDHRLAIALIALGDTLHVLQDMAAPTHVRNDFVPGRLQKLGGSNFDRGSAYERYVSLRYGRTGVPDYDGAPIRRKQLAHYLSSPRWDGLADVTMKHHFSPGTLPPRRQLVADASPESLTKELSAKLPLSEPALSRVDIDCARRRTCYMHGPYGPRAAYRIDGKNRLHFFLNQRCFRATATRLLPLAVGYSAGFVDHILRPALRLTRDGDRLVLSGTLPKLASARARLFWEDEAGTRTLLAEPKVTSTAAPLASVALPAAVAARARRFVAIVDGQDAAKDPVVGLASIAVTVAPPAPVAAPPSGPAEPASAPASAPAEAPPSE